MSWRIAFFHVAFASLYALGVVLSDMLIQGGFQIAPIWPPAGIAFACILLGGVRAWPTVVAGIILGQIFSLPQAPVFHAFSMLANVCGPVAATLLLQKLWPQSLSAVRLKSSFFILIGGAILGVIAASFGALGATLSGDETSYGTIWWLWFLGDLFGVVVCTPAMLALGTHLRRHDLGDQRPDPRASEKLIWLIAAVAAVFAWSSLTAASPNYALAVSFLPLILLGWSALRFDHTFTSVSVMIILLVVVAIIGRGLSGFAPPESVLEGTILLLFFTVIAMLPLLVSAGAHENRYFAEQLTYRANHDFLTGLRNRSAFEEAVREQMAKAQRTGQTGAICYLDLDQFKVVNDTCGHSAGDELLKQISHVLKANMRPGDQIARLGGDEFGLVFDDCDLEEARKRALTITNLIGEFRFVWRRHLFTFTASGGISLIGRDTDNLGRVFADADAACFDAKELGGNRVVVANRQPDGASRHSTAMHWAVRITDALENDRFHLHCQEIVPLDHNDDSDLHFEVLVRMSSEEGRLLMPTSFIPAAERFKMMAKLDRWVVAHTLDALGARPAALKRTEMCSINLSGASLTDATFLGQLEELIVGAHKVPPEKLCFEITETAAIGELSLAMNFISRLRRRGCRFALDDFGSGLSSFGYLRALRVDFLKIDGTFVRDIVDNPVDRAMVRSINEVGQVMGKRTIAEYVETPAAAEMLREIGVNYAQGHAFSRPQPLEAFLDRRMHHPAPF